MKTAEEIRQHLSKYTAKLKPNPNHFIIVDKWNQPYKYEIFDYISECIDEMIIDACHKAVFPSINEINIGVIDVDKYEHIWYNKFNKWSWTKFENGVIKIDERRV